MIDKKQKQKPDYKRRLQNTKIIANAVLQGKAEMIKVNGKEILMLKKARSLSGKK